MLPPTGRILHIKDRANLIRKIRNIWITLETTGKVNLCLISVVLTDRAIFTIFLESEYPGFKTIKADIVERAEWDL